MKLNKSKKGISLIVLVITIIVMIILATAIILSLNSSNIVEKAKEAKTASDMANAKNVVILAKGEWELMTSGERTSNGGTFNVYAERKLQEAGYALEGNGAVNVSSNGVVSTIYVGSDNRKAIIPEGFTVSTKATEDSVTEGLVISDAKGNEFVWVPVDDFSKFERTRTYDGNITEPISDNSDENLTEPLATVCTNYDHDVGECIDTATLSITNDLTGEWAEHASMRASVQENKGFYIGRYETGTTAARSSNSGTTDVLVQKGKPVYNYVAWGPSMTSVSGDVRNQGKGAVELSRNMYKGSTSVVSTLCYGVQWDAALQFIATNPEHADYPLDSTGKGYYAYDEEGKINPEEVQVTGSSDDYATNNIYDMAGNAQEWTMEAGDTEYRVTRGGYYEDDGTMYTASFRETDWYPEEAVNIFTFRIALYIK